MDYTIPEKLLSIDSNAKTIKGQKKGYMTGILYLAPASLAGVGNVCPFASEGCKKACLYTAGRGIYQQIQDSRVNKTRFLMADRQTFLTMLSIDIKRLIKKAEKASLIPCVRLNGTSDLTWELFKRESTSKSLMEEFSTIQFYDYTKHHKRAMAFGAGKLPDNYHITFSLSESNRSQADEVLRNGVNVAAVFSTPRTGQLPHAYAGRPILNGDESDLRFLDSKRGAWIGLRAKGKARKDTSGFVIH